jgi:hypothetical protein
VVPEAPVVVPPLPEPEAVEFGVPVEPPPLEDEPAGDPVPPEAVAEGVELLQASAPPATTARSDC